MAATGVSILWLVFASLSVLAVLGYDVAIKIAADKANPFVFTMLIGFVTLVGQILVYVVYRFVSGNASHGLDKTQISMAVLAGLSIVLMEITFFLAVRHGGLILSNGFWFIGGLMMTILAGYFIFGEAMTWNRVAGLICGLLAVFFLVKG